jgi:hypothetical protein
MPSKRSSTQKIDGADGAERCGSITRLKPYESANAAIARVSDSRADSSVTTLH